MFSSDPRTTDDTVRSSTLDRLLAPLRRRIFAKYMFVTLAAGSILTALVLSFYWEHRRTEQISGVSTEIATIASRLARPLAQSARSGDRRGAGNLLSVFASFPYAICADLVLDQGAAPSASWPPIGCERMQKPGLDIAVPLPAAGPEATMALRIDRAVLGDELRAEMAVIVGLVAIGALLLALASAGGFLWFIHRPLGRLSAAMARFEQSGEHERVRPGSPDELGRLVRSYNAMIDREVERVEALRDAHEAIMDSVGYATRIQHSLLPPTDRIPRNFAEFAVLWQPRDGVGGDFYWMHEGENGCTLAVIDCTGHGVPGGFMTMLAVATLERIFAEEPALSPGQVLTRLSDMLRELLRERSAYAGADDGMDAAICQVDAAGRLTFAGAKLSLLVSRAGTVRRIKGNRISIGYLDTRAAPKFDEHGFAPGEADLVVVTTDGLLDQPGGAKGLSFGHSRLTDTVRRNHDRPAREIVDAASQAFDDYAGEQSRRDDVTVVAFRPAVASG